MKQQDYNYGRVTGSQFDKFTHRVNTAGVSVRVANYDTRGGGDDLRVVRPAG